MKELFCPVCKKYVDYDVKSVLNHYKKDDICFDYEEKICVCKYCKEELYSDEIQKENQLKFEEAYKNSNRIITNDEIQEILNKYSITKRNLPFVLGLGELTITRYLDGYIPTPKISNLLKNVLNNPGVYKDYLEKNKNKLKHNAYVKSSNKVNSILGIDDFDEELKKYADYIVANNEETTNLVLNKLLFYCDVFYRIFFGRKPFRNQCKAWTHGPVYGRIYFEYKNFGSDPIEKEIKDINISDQAKELIETIIECFGLYSGKVLSYFTHHDGPWKEARDKGLDVIESEKIDEYAKTIKTIYGIKSFNDIHKYSDKMFNDYKTYIESNNIK